LNIGISSWSKKLECVALKFFHALEAGSLELAKKFPLYILPMAEAAELLHNDRTLSQHQTLSDYCHSTYDCQDKPE
jgi:hypothetical protein